MAVKRDRKGHNRSRMRAVSFVCSALAVSAAALALLRAMPLPGLVTTDILTANGDNYRTNSNLHETQLTLGNVQPGSFGKLGSYSADGQVYTQPLYASNLLFPSGSKHNVLFVTTMHNTVYAYDADIPSDDGLLWSVNLGPALPTTFWNAPYSDITPEAGILGTGAIDLQRGVLYVVAETLENNAAVFRLHALDLVSGGERMNGPIVIQAVAAGSGAQSSGGQISFDPAQHLQRPGLLVANDAVYIAFGSHMDQIPWHGWIISYSASDLTAQLGAFVTTPNGQGGAIWQSGRGLAADDAGSVYSMSGNGDVDNSSNLGESFIRLSGPRAALADWFTPANWQTLDGLDADLSTGPAVIPGTHTIVGGDKYGQLYLINGDWMGRLATATFQGATILGGAVVGGMFNFALWSQPETAYIYVQGEQDPVKSYSLTHGIFSAAPVSMGATPVNVPRVGLTISADGARNGILWETTGDYSQSSVPGTLHAYDASNLATELWNSDINSSRDNLGGFMKFTNPTVIRGKVYVATSSGVAVYGLICPNATLHGGTPRSGASGPCLAGQI